MAKVKETEIGEANAEDIPSLVSLLHELFTLESDFTPDRDKQARALQLITGNPERGRIFVLRAGSQVIGMVNALFTISTAEGGPVVLLEDVILAKKYRGQGLGRKLVEHVLEWARRENFLRVTVLADSTNEAALNFYRQLGFRRSSMVVNRLQLNLKTAIGRR